MRGPFEEGKNKKTFQGLKIPGGEGKGFIMGKPFSLKLLVLGHSLLWTSEMVYSPQLSDNANFLKLHIIMGTF